MVGLLQRIRRRLPDRTYVDRLFCTSPESVARVTAGRQAADDLGSATPVLGLIHPLTIREQKVLEPSIQRLRDKEIATRLFASIRKVNFDLRNIYRRLGVSNRREAVAKANGD